MVPGQYNGGRVSENARAQVGGQVMRQVEPQPCQALRPPDWLRLLPHEHGTAASDRLGWVGLEAGRCRATPAFERDLPALTHHRLFLFSRPPEELDLRYEGVKRTVPPPAGSGSLLPAGSPGRVRSSCGKGGL